LPDLTPTKRKASSQIAHQTNRFVIQQNRHVFDTHFAQVNAPTVSASIVWCQLTPASFTANQLYNTSCMPPYVHDT